jgi:hypothetical protein
MFIVHPNLIINNAVRYQLKPYFYPYAARQPKEFYTFRGIEKFAKGYNLAERNNLNPECQKNKTHQAQLMADRL